MTDAPASEIVNLDIARRVVSDYRREYAAFEQAIAGPNGEDPAFFVETVKRFTLKVIESPLVNVAEALIVEVEHLRSKGKADP